MLWFRFFVFFTLILFLGCSQPSSQYVSLDANLTLHSEKEEALAERFVTYWDARSTNNYKKSYALELPSYRFLASLEQHIVKLPIHKKVPHVTLHSIELIDLKRNIAAVTSLHNQHKAVEKWIYIDNKWYHRYYRPDFPEADIW